MLKFYMYKFVIPFYYLTYSRLKSLPEKLSLLWIYPIFLMVFLFAFYQVDVIPNFLSFLMALVAWMSIYEIGYMENDALTIKKEAYPNLRINQEGITFIEENFWKITLVRLLFFMSLSFNLYFFNLWNIQQILLFVFLVILGRFTFYLHNRIRSRWNIITYFFLCLSKYWVFPILYLGLYHGIAPYWIILICFPVLRTIEHAVKPKYKIKWLKKMVGTLDNFRVKYYALVLGIAVLISFYSGYTRVFIYASAYFFIFRVGILLLIGTGNFSRESLT
jgi:hypothetical protein